MLRQSFRVTLILASLSAAPMALAAQNPAVTQLIPGDLSDADLESYGTAVAIDRTRAVLGTVVDIHQGENTGSAYVFEQDVSGNWVEAWKLYPSSSFPLGGAHFGESVAIQGDRILVGAPQENGYGYVYVFERLQNGSWVETAKFTATDISYSDDFGIRVALSGRRALIVSYGFAGQNMYHSAYIFERQADGSWLQRAKLFAPTINGPATPFESAALEADRVLLGSPGGKGAALGTGLALVFERQFDGTWVLDSRLWAADGENGDKFGRAVSLDGDRLAIGAEDDDDPGWGSGSAHVFERQGDGSWTHVAKVSNRSDALGRSVSLSGDRLLVGSPYSTERNKKSVGLAYVFQRQQDGSWLEAFELRACEGSSGSNLGSSASLSLDSALVGAPHQSGLPGERGAGYLFNLAAEGSPCSAPPGTFAGESKLWADDGTMYDEFGAVVSYSNGRALVGADTIEGAYVFEPTGFAHAWEQVAKLVPTDSAVIESVSLSGNRAVLGSPESAVSGFARAGAAYVFERQSTGAWVQVAKLVANDPSEGVYFGVRVSLERDRLLVGGRYSGKAYLFERQVNGTWLVTAKLKAADGNHLSGGTVALRGDRALVGAYLPDSLPGAAYLFERTSLGNWIQVAKLQASDGAPGVRFGYGLALVEDRALVGGLFTDGVYFFERASDGSWPETAKVSVENGLYPGWWAVSLLGDRALIGATGGNEGAGAVHLFERSATGTWNETRKFTASDGHDGDRFGAAIDLGMDTVLIGAPGDNDQSVDSGSAYVFPIDP